MTGREFKINQVIKKNSTILLFNKGKRPIIQDFKGRIKDIILLKDKPRIISKDLKVKFY